MNVRVHLSAWAVGRRPLSCAAEALISQPPHTERARWLAKPPASSWTLTNSLTFAVWSAPPPPRKPWLSEPVSSSAASVPRPRPMRKSRPNWAAGPTPSPSGGTASTANALLVWQTFPVAAARPLFPPEERHQVIVLATTRPADVGVPTSHWSLDDLAYHILKEAHYRDMSRSTVQRILAEADLKPHKSRYWLHSDDPHFEAKALDICRLYLAAPA